MKEQIAILIPAYNPNTSLIKIVQELSKSEENVVIVVNDGTKDKTIFHKIQNQCKLLEHTENLGKGRALKTGLKYILQNYPEIKGVVTADADGQHKIKDIEKVKLVLLKNDKSIVLGCRNFKEKNIPLRNRIGNIVINFFFKLKTNVEIKDTQTGLRGIPINLVKEIIDIPGEKFDYEMKTLINLCKKNKIIEIPIETIYQQEITSAFKPLEDSYKILKGLKKD